MTEILSEAALAARLEALAAGRHIVAIAGAPGSGKSTVADHLADTLNRARDGRAAVLPMDGYHFDDALLAERGHAARKGAPHTFDVGGLAHMIRRLRQNDEDEIAVPVFDRTLEIARAGARTIPRTADVILVEGNYLLLRDAPWDGLAPLFDITVRIDVPEDELRRRLERRWAGYGLSEAQIRAKLEENDLPNGRHVAGHSRDADIVLVQTG